MAGYTGAMFKNLQAQRAASTDALSAFPETSSQNAPPTPSSSYSMDPLEPAIDGPPSPERIRAVSKQLKRQSFRERHFSQQTASSKSSSLLSVTSERPSWELGPDILSRRSSQRSSTSSNPSRETADNALSFGKGIFNRKSKPRKEGTEASAPLPSLSSRPSMNDLKIGSKDLMANMFARRKGSRADIDSQEQKRLQISGPYNFQHLTHTQKGSVPDLDRTSKMDLVSEFAGMRAGQKPSIGSLKGIQAAEIYSAEVSSDSLPLQGELSPAIDVVSPRSEISQFESRNRSGSVLDKELPATPGEAFFKKHSHSISQDMAKLPPPRPKRSPSEPPFPSPIPPPPRMSSRVSTRLDDQDVFTAFSFDRPPTSTTFRTSQQCLPLEEQSEPSMTAPSPEDVAWPLTPPTMSSVPEVPEEEESQFLSRHKSQASVASNKSSLRGSFSAPMLRQMSLKQRGHQRPPSNASDTLGQFSDVTVQQRAESSAAGTPVGDTFFHDDWEDDIDYCYDHEAEADCDYAWERPSGEMWRESDRGFDSYFDDERHNLFAPSFNAGNAASARAISPHSPMSPRSKPKSHGPTNSTLTIPVTTNFSLPDRGHNRTLSRASSNLEGQEFTLSPSLLIPNDYQQQMLSYEREANNHLQELDEDDVPLGNLYSKSALMLKVRSSSSTTDSALSETSLVSSRHKSTLSTSTAFTRWTGISGTGSVDWQQHGEKLLDAPILKEQVDDNTTPTADAIDMTLPGTDVDASGGLHQRTASEANILAKFISGNGAEKSSSERQTIKARRRAKTTSRSHNGPPQFGLFPQVPPSPRS